MKKYPLIWVISFVCCLSLMCSVFRASYAVPASIVLSEPEADAINNPIRALHFVLAPSVPDFPAVPYSDAEKVIRAAKLAGMNTIIVQIANSVNFDSLPTLTRKGAWSKDELRRLVEMASANEITLIPELKLLTHQEKFIQGHFPDLLYNAVTYDPSNSEVYKKIFPLLDEVIELIHPTAILIGHDEVVGWNARHAKKKLKEGEIPLPASLFLQDVLTLHGFLKSRGVETWMWGDMLLSPDEFPNMLSRHLHGSNVGYGKVLRAKIPKDIVICDWHYFDDQSDFPTLDVMQKEGFRVLGSTWKKENTTRNFSRYAAKHDAHGMIATTWFHVVRKEWDVVEYIIKVSGEAFSKDFPDKK